MQHLAADHPAQYHLQTMRIFCSFLRENVQLGAVNAVIQRTAVSEILRAIGKSGAAQIGIEGREQFLMNLSGLDLSGLEWGVLDIPGERLNFSAVQFYESNFVGASLPGAFLFQASFASADLTDAYMPGAMLDSCQLYRAVLRGALLEQTNLDHADLMSADLSGARLGWATLKWADLRQAKLNGTDLEAADLAEADVSDADFTGCVGLTQEQLDRAVAVNGHAPRLGGCLDAETGRVLVWGAQEPVPGSSTGRLALEHRIEPGDVDRYPVPRP